MALERAHRQIHAGGAGVLEARIERILARTKPPARPPGRIPVRQRGRIVFVAPEDISHVEAADNHVVLHLLNGQRHMLRESLAEMEARLSPGSFARVNRSTLVQLEQVRELKSTTYGDYTVILRNGTRIPLSRTLRGKLEGLVGL